MIGQILGHYHIDAKIGEGGMGVVYRARDEFLHRDVAIKVLSKGIVADSSARDFVLHEARSSSALNHPNVCTIYEVGELAGETFIVMELVEGKPLNGLVAGNGLPVESVLRYGVQIAAALAHSHGRNIVHRDLKSSNIVITSEGLVKVLDFGLAKHSEKDALEGVTQSISPVEFTAIGLTGTLQYMAPEVLRGQEADQLSDIWALGVVLYEAASGRLPFKGKTAFELSSAIFHELPAPLPAHIPLALWAVVQRCLAKEPVHRYQRAAEVQAALEPLLAATAIGATAPSSEPRGFRTTVLRGMRHLHVKDGDALLLVGTSKGAFLLSSRPDRTNWDVAGPYFHGQAIYAMAYDHRQGRHRLWASTHSPIWGSVLRSSNDFGKTWTNPLEANVKFPADCGVSLKNIWQIALGREDEPDTMYCGVEPAALFSSQDAGETWSLVRGLFDHPHRPRWVPGNGGLCLHTILLDPAARDRMYAAISAGGVYRTDDGGRSWQARNKGVRVAFMPEKYPEFGQCVHKIAAHPSRPDRLFLQNHWGLYRSDDRAESWQDIANGVPSDFGFPLVVHPRDPDCVYILPMESDEFRCTPDERLRVFRTRNAGASWEPLTRGLPQKKAYVTVLRDAMAADCLRPAGIYFGTRSGELYASADEGKTWKRILEGLPQICCVKAAFVGQPPELEQAGRKSAEPRTVKVSQGSTKPSRRSSPSRGKKR
jgi:serine/threonine protein kinase